MQFAEFLQQIKSLQQTRGTIPWSVLSFQGKEYPALFCSALIDVLRKAGASLVVHDIASVDVAATIAQWSMSFLGQQHLYWCGDGADLDAATKKQMLGFLRTYRGPHTVLFFMQEEVEGISSVLLPAHIERAQAEQIVAL